MKTGTIGGVEYPLTYAPMWYHKQGLSQTASGYGGKLNTGHTVYYLGRTRRVYCSIYSNIGRCYIVVHGEEITVS